MEEVIGYSFEGVCFKSGFGIFRNINPLLTSHTAVMFSHDKTL